MPSVARATGESDCESDEAVAPPRCGDCDEGDGVTRRLSASDSAEEGSSSDGAELGGVTEPGHGSLDRR